MQIFTFCFCVCRSVMLNLSLLVLLTQFNSTNAPIVIYGLRLTGTNKPDYIDSVKALTVWSDIKVDVVIFGEGIYSIKNVTFRIGTCMQLNNELKGVILKRKSNVLRVRAKFSKLSKDQFYVLCVSPKSSNVINSSERQIHVDSSGSPFKLRYIYVQIPVCILLLALSALFSGLNLGILTLEPLELELFIESGNPKEKKYAAIILPVRRRANFVLCSIVTANCLVNVMLTILFQDISNTLPSKASFLVALFVPTFAIVIFGEIIPQTLCHKRGLWIAAHTIYVTYATMGITCFISWPLSKLLDCAFGKQGGSVYDQSRLLKLVQIQIDDNKRKSDRTELKIVRGALLSSHTTVATITKTMDQVFMLPIEQILNSPCIADIIASGYTRIPVYENEDRNQVVSVLNIKDLAIIDPDEGVLVKSVCQFFHSTIRFVLDSTPTGKLLEEFSQGDHHLTMVVRMLDVEKDCDPKLNLVGLCTMEDIIEQIINFQILDEHDVCVSQQTASLQRLERSRNVEAVLKTLKSNVPSKATVQLRLATLQFLTQNVSAFSQEILAQEAVDMLVNNYTSTVPANYGNKIYSEGIKSTEFVLLMEGRLLVEIGSERMKFEVEPFQYFGAEVLEKVLSRIIPKDSSSKTAEASSSGDDVAFIPDFTLTTCPYDHDVILLRIDVQNYRQLVQQSDQSIIAYSKRQKKIVAKK